MGPGFRRGRRRGLIVGAAVGSSIAGANARKNAAASEPDAVEAAPDQGDEQIAQIEKLAQLKDQGILTQEEFNAKKKQILGL